MEFGVWLQYKAVKERGWLYLRTSYLFFFPKPKERFGNGN